MSFGLCPKTVPAPEASPATKPKEAGLLLPPLSPPPHHPRQCPCHEHHGMIALRCCPQAYPSHGCVTHMRGGGGTGVMSISSDTVGGNPSSSAFLRGSKDAAVLPGLPEQTAPSLAAQNPGPLLRGGLVREPCTPQGAFSHLRS